MTNSQRLANVRKALNHWLQQHVGPGHHLSPGSESIVIRDGFYCGRRFSATSHHAVWFVEEDELKIYGAGKRMVASMHSDEIDRWSELEVNSTAAATSAETDQPWAQPQRRAA